MKTKRILALVVAVLVAMTCFASCRTKDENAFVFTYGDKTVNIRTALYMCMLMDADMEFQNVAVTAAEEKGQEYDDYKELKYEDKDYDTWTKQKAKEACEMYAYTELEFDRLGLSIVEEEQAYIDSYAESQWYGDETTGGVGTVYEANGVSLSTFKEYFTNLYWKEDLVYNFYIEEVDTEEHAEEDHTHEDGSTHKAEDVKDEEKLDPEIKKLNGSLRPESKKINVALKDNYIPVYMIDVSFLDDQGNEKSKETKKEQLETLKGYADKLNAGTNFKDIYSAYQLDFGLATDEESVSTDSSSYESMLLSAKANKIAQNGEANDENFEEVLKLANGTATVIENDDCYTLVYRRDILKASDSQGNSYKDSYEISAIKTIVDDDYQKIVDEAIKSLKVNENSSAIKFYAPDKIDYLTETTAAETQTETAQ